MQIFITASCINDRTAVLYFEKMRNSQKYKIFDCGNNKQLIVKKRSTFKKTSQNKVENLNYTKLKLT